MKSIKIFLKHNLILYAKTKQKMKVSEQIAIMRAYEDGKTIEKKGQDDTEWKSVEYIEDYPFDFFCEQYRVKQECKYRPFESVEEAFNEAKKHGFWLKHKLSGRICFLTNFLEERNTIYINSRASVCGLDDYVWVDDGSPCGVKIK